MVYNYTWSILCCAIFASSAQRDKIREALQSDVVRVRRVGGQQTSAECEGFWRTLPFQSNAGRWVRWPSLAYTFPLTWVSLSLSHILLVCRFLLVLLTMSHLLLWVSHGHCLFRKTYSIARRERLLCMFYPRTIVIVCKIRVTSLSLWGLSHILTCPYFSQKIELNVCSTLGSLSPFPSLLSPLSLTSLSSSPLSLGMFVQCKHVYPRAVQEFVDYQEVTCHFLVSQNESPSQSLQHQETRVGYSVSPLYYHFQIQLTMSWLDWTNPGSIKGRIHEEARWNGQGNLCLPFSVVKCLPIAVMLVH